MNNVLRKLAIGVGMFLLLVSIYWSKIVFGFGLAGDANSVHPTAVSSVGYGLAISFSIIQFIFSTNYKELNATLILLGISTYIYSVYTNYAGILFFQGASQNSLGAGLLAAFMDIAPEPMIAWGLYESLTGDFLGNLWTTISSIFAAPSRKNIRRPLG